MAKQVLISTTVCVECGTKTTLQSIQSSEIINFTAAGVKFRMAAVKRLPVFI